MDIDIFGGWGPTIARGTWMKVQVALLSAVIGCALGLLGAMGCLSRWRAVRALSNAYVTSMRGLPQLLLVLLIYYGSTVALMRVLAALGLDTKSIEVPPYAAGVFALSLIFGGYAAEVFRGAFLAVPVGQVEAARAVGLNGLQVFMYIQSPQMLRFALPGLGNIWLSTLKDTSLISIVGLGELMKAAELATSNTRRALFFYLSAGAIYLMLTLASAVVLHWMEKRANKGQRKD